MRGGFSHSRCLSGGVIVDRMANSQTEGTFELEMQMPPPPPRSCLETSGPYEALVKLTR